jgi:hypothetical protein
MKKVENELTLKCSMCSSITKTPEFASFEDNLDCEGCEMNLAYCDKLYYGFSKSPLLWVLWEHEIEDGNCNIEIIKAEIL